MTLLGGSLFQEILKWLKRILNAGTDTGTWRSWMDNVAVAACWW